jgi:hypothetical protein
MAAASTDVTTRQRITAEQYNNLRADLLSITTGHFHDGSTGREHGDGNFLLRNPADTFSYTIKTSGIVAARNLTVPLLTGNDTFAVLGVAATFSAIMTHSADIIMQDGSDYAVGTGSDALLRWSTADASAHSLVLALDDTNQTFHITDVGAVATDWNVADATHPSLRIHSNTTPATDYLRIGEHDGTTAYIDNVGGTTLAFQIAGTTEASLTAAVLDISGLDLLNDDDDEILMGTGGDWALLWSDGDSSNHAAVIAIGDTSQSLHITDYGARATDWNIAATTHPNVYIHSNTTPATDYLRLGDHDGTTADIDVVGGTTLAFKIAGTTEMSLAANSISGNVLASVAQLETGTDAVKIITPDVLAGSNLGERIVQIRVFDVGASATTGDRKATFVVPSSMNGMNIVEVHAEVDTAGSTNTLDIQLRNVTQTADILSTKLTVDSAETGSDTAATAAVINTSEDDLQTFDVIAVDSDAIHATASKGLVITIIARLP